MSAISLKEIPSRPRPDTRAVPARLGSPSGAAGHNRSRSCLGRRNANSTMFAASNAALGWLSWRRPPRNDFEESSVSIEAMIYVAMYRLIVRRLEAV